MTFYLKGLLVSLGSVALLYVTLYVVGIVRMLYLAGRDVDVHAPLGATAGNSFFGYSWFWLWSMIIFASTFLIYLRVMSGRPLH